MNINSNLKRSAVRLTRRFKGPWNKNNEPLMAGSSQINKQRPLEREPQRARIQAALWVVAMIWSYTLFGVVLISGSAQTGLIKWLHRHGKRST